VAWGACNLLATLSLYYAGFALAGQVVAGWEMGRHRRGLVAVTALLGLLLAPWIAVVLEQAARQAPEPHSANPTQGTLWSLASAAFPAPFIERRVVQLAWVVALGGLLAFRLVRGLPTRAELAFALIAGLAFAGPWLVRILGIAQVNPRHWLAVAPSVALCLASCAAAVPPRGPRAAVMAIALLFTLGGTISFERNLSPTDWRRLSAQVEARREPGEPMLFFPSRGALIYRPYQRLPGARAGMPENVVLDRYPLDSQLVVVTDRDVDLALDRAGVPRERSFWLLVETQSESLGLDVLERYVSARCRQHERAVANGLWAVRLSCSSRAALQADTIATRNFNDHP
jgi:hypothetical protein